VDLNDAHLFGTYMQQAEIWRTRFADDYFGVVIIDLPHQRRITTEEFAALRADILKDVKDEARRDEGLRRIGILDPTKKGPATDLTKILAKDYETFEKALADALENISCSVINRSAASTVRGLMGQGRMTARLAASVLAPGCPVSAELTDEDKAQLKAYARTANPPTAQTSTPRQ